MVRHPLWPRGLGIKKASVFVLVFAIDGNPTWRKNTAAQWWGPDSFWPVLLRQMVNWDWDPKAENWLSLPLSLSVLGKMWPAVTPTSQPFQLSFVLKMTGWWPPPIWAATNKIHTDYGIYIYIYTGQEYTYFFAWIGMGLKFLTEKISTSCWPTLCFFFEAIYIYKYTLIYKYILNSIYSLIHFV